MPDPALRLAVAGSPENAVGALTTLLGTRHEVVLVLTRPAAPTGRGRGTQPTALARAAVDLGLPVVSPQQTNDPRLRAALAETGVDCVVVVAYGALIRTAELAAVPLGWVNVHYSLLPRWRGASPVAHAIWHGDRRTGVTIFRLDTGLDTGPVLDQASLDIPPRATAGELLDLLTQLGQERLPAVLDALAAGTAVPQPQQGPASHAPRLTVTDARLALTCPAGEVDQQVRAMTPRPGAWTTAAGLRLRIGPVTADAAAPALAPGELAADGRSVWVGCQPGAVRLGSVQPAGGRMMPAIDWWRGARLAQGTRCD